MNVSEENALQVVCAWPVSGQYGPGSRVLYYVLIAACVFARKIEWLRNAALAAAMLLPAVAAIHGIVLAALHIPGAVDMDIFGAFQLCAIGILVAPVTVRMSKTYFYDPARNAIFLWIGLILAGLLSLTVEFYRADTTPCRKDDHGNPLPSSPKDFPYEKATCGLRCSTEVGPFSPMRGGAADNIYVVPAPDRLSFGTATLLAAACCVHALLWMLSMWDKILEINWNRRFRDIEEGAQQRHADEMISGTNGATERSMGRVNGMIKMVLSIVVIPIFAGAGLAILIVGERNFFSKQVAYETEPMASIGQWGPIAGTFIAAVGTIYIVFAKDLEPKDIDDSLTSSSSQGDQVLGRMSGEARSIRSAGSTNNASSAAEPFPSLVTRTTTRYSERPPTGTGGRKTVRKWALWVNKKTGNIAAGLDDDMFRRGPVTQFPEIPGEAERNNRLGRVREIYNRSPSLRPSRSRAESCRSVISRLELSDTLPSPPEPTFSLSNSNNNNNNSDSRDPGEGPSSLGRRTHANTMPAQGPGSPGSPSLARAPRRRDTLEVPSPSHSRPHVVRSIRAEMSGAGDDGSAVED